MPRDTWVLSVPAGRKRRVMAMESPYSPGYNPIRAAPKSPGSVRVMRCTPGSTCSKVSMSAKWGKVRVPVPS